MKVNYVLMYGTPYLKYREFETFEDISKFLVNKRIVNYSIFKKLEDKEEVEMIYRDNDIRYLEKENERLNENNQAMQEEMARTWEKLDKLRQDNNDLEETRILQEQIINDYKSRNEKAIEYINENWGHWCSNHCEYATETINILNGDDEE